MAYGLLATSLGIISLPSPWIGSQIWEHFGPKVPFVLTGVLGALALLPAWTKLVAPVPREVPPEEPRPPFTVERPSIFGGIPAAAPLSGTVAPTAEFPPRPQVAAPAAAASKAPPFKAGVEPPYVTVLVGATEGILPPSDFSPSNIFASIATIVRRYGGVFQQQGISGFYAVFGSGQVSARPQVSALLATHAALDVLDFVNSVTDKSAQGSRAIRLGIGIATGLSEPASASPTKTSERKLATPRENADRLQRIAMRSDTACLVISGDTYRFLDKVKDQFLFGRFGKIPAQERTGELMLYEVVGRKRSLVEGPAT